MADAAGVGAQIVGRFGAGAAVACQPVVGENDGFGIAVAVAGDSDGALLAARGFSYFAHFSLSNELDDDAQLARFLDVW